MTEILARQMRRFRCGPGIWTLGPRMAHPLSTFFSGELHPTGARINLPYYTPYRRLLRSGASANSWTRKSLGLHNSKPFVGNASRQRKATRAVRLSAVRAFWSAFKYGLFRDRCRHLPVEINRNVGNVCYHSRVESTTEAGIWDP